MSLNHISEGTFCFYRMNIKYITLALIALALPSVSSLQAGQRRFTFVYESTTSPKGQFESRIG